MFAWNGWHFPDEDPKLIHWMKTYGEQRAGRPSYQQHKYDFCLALSDKKRTAIDIGSHIGLWSYLMAQDFEAVHAFEPSSPHAECWRLNLENNPNAALYRVAVGATSGTVHFAPRNDESGLGEVSDVGERVELHTIDQHCFDDVDFVKVDCDGYDHLALVGARETLLRCKPVVCVEQAIGFGVKYSGRDDAAIRFLFELGAVHRAKANHDHIFSWD